MPLLPSSGPNGLFHPFPGKASSRSGSGVPKLNPNRNIAAAKASGEAAADFSQFLDANVGDSSSETKTSPAQTSGQLPSSDGALLNQIKSDSLQTAWATSPGIPAPASDVPDTAVSVARDGTRADSAKVQMLADAIESALPPIATAVAKHAEKPGPSADAQKEAAPPALPAQTPCFAARLAPVSD
jgi:hypothetical protein